MEFELAPARPPNLKVPEGPRPPKPSERTHVHQRFRSVQGAQRPPRSRRSTGIRSGILAEIGLVFRDPRAVEILVRAGARQDPRPGGFRFGGAWYGRPSRRPARVQVSRTQSCEDRHGRRSNVVCRPRIRLPRRSTSTQPSEPRTTRIRELAKLAGWAVSGGADHVAPSDRDGPRRIASVKPELVRGLLDGRPYQRLRNLNPPGRGVLTRPGPHEDLDRTRVTEHQPISARIRSEYRSIVSTWGSLSTLYGSESAW